MGKWKTYENPKGAKLQAARRNRGIHEVLADDKDYFKVIADARVKLERDTAPAVPCIEKEDSRGKPQAVATSIDASSMRESEATTYGRHRRERVCGKLSPWPGAQASFYSRSYADTRSQSRRG